jgi:hypothetical protein
MPAINNFLSLSGNEVLRDYQHASRLYVTDKYSKAPKLGFIYFIQININPNAIIDESWAKNRNDVGLLAKKADLPKFNISMDTINQYNRKTLVQTKLNYQPISIELHDDNSDLTHNFWVNYYKHYYADGNYNDSSVSSVSGKGTPESFRDTKFGTVDYTYGRYDRGDKGEFLDSINIFVLHQGKFTEYTLVNPKITEWTHDSVNQSDGIKILQNRMTVAYENVFYNEGEIKAGIAPEGWALNYYDRAGSPYALGGNPKNSPIYTRTKSDFDKPGKDRVFGVVGGQYKSQNPLLNIGEILAKNLINRKGLGKLGPVGYAVASGVLGQTLGSGAGKYSSAPPPQNQPGIFNLPGGVGINIFKGINTSVDGKIRANPAAIILPPRR